MTPHLKLIILGLRHLHEEPNAIGRADMLDAAAAAIAGEADDLAEQAAATAALIRSAENAQGRFLNLLP
ncbi:hypothetical protein OVA24_16660 [Luteolibacter sp. SL250]|uniref:hypothetical protein n=1 Tax=Luteolibacter sp. SL250 TaxID=2995170 RepID=UPI00226EC520|nr:hypothetical protein [Luteolibacter sp. SL250]WAC18864.1 hypothetical protein OVA24_16660 [Luteolibacter sp. SL250]